MFASVHTLKSCCGTYVSCILVGERLDSFLLAQSCIIGRPVKIEECRKPECQQEELRSYAPDVELTYREGQTGFKAGNQPKVPVRDICSLKLKPGGEVEGKESRVQT